MTQDFIDLLAEAAQKEGCPYLIIVQTLDGKCVNVESDLDQWKPAKVGRPLLEDLYQLFEVHITNL